MELEVDIGLQPSSSSRLWQVEIVTVAKTIKKGAVEKVVLTG